MALKLNRLTKFYGGITIGEKDNREGVCLNIEEFDIFSNPNIMEPETIFAADSMVVAVTSITRSSTTATVTTTANHGFSSGDTVTIAGATQTDYNGAYTITVTGDTTFIYTVANSPATPATGTITATIIWPRAISGYTVDDADNMYAITKTVDGYFQILKKANSSSTSPGSWSHLYKSTTILVSSTTGIGWHKWDAATEWLYVVTGLDSATTRTVYRVKTDGTGPTSTDSGATTMTLTGLNGSFDRFPKIRIDGELFIGSGQTIVKIDSTGVFVPATFTIPNGWTCVSFAPLGDNLAILAKSVEAGNNTSKVFFWDLTATTGVLDEVTIPMGGPQIVVNHNEYLRVMAAKNSVFRAYQLNGKVPVRTHQLTNIAIETDTQPICPDNTKFLRDNIVYFGLWKTDKSGIYAIGQADDAKPLAMVLSKRFNTSDYSLHKPFAAFPSGPNLYASYDDNGTKTMMKIEGSSPTRSSNAVYESILVDASSPESAKEWPGFLLVAKPIPASCNIKVDARTDNASSYDSNSLKTLDNSNDQVLDGGTADTYWEREWTSLVGRALQFRIRCTSSGTSKASIYMISLKSRDMGAL